MCDPADLRSPLTPKATLATAPIKPYRGSAERAPRHEVPHVTIGNIQLRLWDRRRTAPAVMLQDEAINSYVHLLSQREQTWAAAEKQPTRLHFFNTFMFSTMIRNDKLAYSYEAVHRWSRHLNFKSYDAVFVPVNLGKIHWALGVAYAQRRHVDTYDSLGLVPTWIPACLVRWGRDDSTVHGHKRGKCT